MIVIGLTGSIGMGKSTLAKQFAALGAKTVNADAIVHRLLAAGGKAVDAVDNAFPGVKKNGAIDRKALGAIVFSDKKKRLLLESILHPLVVLEEMAFVKRESKKGAKVIVLDIPLLFETGADSRVDLTLTATAPYFIQKQRVLKRMHMSEEKFMAIVNNQMPDFEKQQLADAVITTGLGKAFSMRQVKLVMELLRET